MESSKEKSDDQIKNVNHNDKVIESATELTEPNSSITTNNEFEITGNNIRPRKLDLTLQESDEELDYEDIEGEQRRPTDFIPM